MFIRLVSIHGFFKGTGQFPIQKCAIFCKFKEINELRGGALVYAAQAISPIDAEIAEKGHLWTENRLVQFKARLSFPYIFQASIIRPPFC